MQKILASISLEIFKYRIKIRIDNRLEKWYNGRVNGGFPKITTVELEVIIAAIK